MKSVLLLFAPLALSACATYESPSRDDPVATARLGEPVSVDGLRVVPLEVLEDSRCPIDVQCIQAGTVRITARIRYDGNAEVREMTLGRSIRVGGRDLQLVQLRPEPRSDLIISPRDYRFTFEIRP